MKNIQYILIAEEKFNEFEQKLNLIFSRIEIMKSKISKIQYLLENNGNEKKLEWLSKEDAANVLGVKPCTIESYMRKNLLPYTKITEKLYFKFEDIEKLLENNYQINTKIKTNETTKIYR